MKSIILFDIDYTLSDRAFLRKFGRKYLANLVHRRIKEINPVVDRAIVECCRQFGVFNIYYYAKLMSRQFHNPELEKQIIDMFLKSYPYEKAIYPEVWKTLNKLREKYVLGIQSDGEKVFQMKKIHPIRSFFSEKFTYIFKNKTIEIYKKINKIKNRVVVVDDKPEHINLLMKNSIRAILLNRGPYAAKFTENPKAYVYIKQTISNISELPEALT